MKNAMSIKHMGITDWMKNKSWYYVDYERNRYVLTDKALDEAKISFERWKKINRVEWDDKNK